MSDKPNGDDGEYTAFIKALEAVQDCDEQQPADRLEAVLGMIEWSVHECRQSLDDIRKQTRH